MHLLDDCATFSYLIVLTGEEWKHEFMKFNVHIHDVYIPVGVHVVSSVHAEFPLAERQSAQLGLLLASCISVTQCFLNWGRAPSGGHGAASERALMNRRKIC